MRERQQNKRQIIPFRISGRQRKTFFYFKDRRECWSSLMWYFWWGKQLQKVFFLGKKRVIEFQDKNWISKHVISAKIKWRSSFCCCCVFDQNEILRKKFNCIVISFVYVNSIVLNLFFFLLCEILFIFKSIYLRSRKQSVQRIESNIINRV